LSGIIQRVDPLQPFCPVSDITHDITQPKENQIKRKRKEKNTSRFRIQCSGRNFRVRGLLLSFSVPLPCLCGVY
jgi:hypothetical protein